MKKNSLLIFALLCNVQVFATHIFGGELLYTNISGNTYKVTLTLYGDCASSIFNSLYTSSPTIGIYDGSSLVKSINLTFDTNSGTEVSPVCAAELKNTSCNGGTLPGVKQFFFTDTVTLPYTSANWDFIFAGSLGATTNAGRSSNISNIVNPGASIMYLYAKLDNTLAANSSPQYTTIPTPYYCINVAQQYNPGAVDPDGDSLVFKLVPGLVSGSPVSYISPYTATQPLSADGFTFDSSNGQMNFSLNLVQDALIVNEVDEYRNGKLIGTSMREMAFVALSSCTNAPPINTNSNSFTDITGGVVADTNLLISCSDLSFTISPTDPNNDTMDISWVGLPPHATITVTGNATPTPKVVFNWPAPYVGPLGSLHTFYVTYKNRGCPLSSKKTVAYNIRVSYPPSASLSQIAPTSCIDAASLQFTINQEDGADPIVQPYNITLYKDGVAYRQYKNVNGNFIDGSLPVGNYVAVATNPALSCNATITDTLHIADSGTYPYPPTTAAIVNYCVNQTPVQLSATTMPGATLQWFNADSKLPIAPTPPTTIIDTTTWFVNALYKTCQSVEDTIKVYVHNNPVATILNKEESVCIGDKIYLEATGGELYSWAPQQDVSTDEQGRPYTQIMEPTTYIVTATNQFGCTDTASIRYADIMQCCQFSYPTVFSPNNDGKNDHFRIVTYGNMVKYDLKIFNRWGQLVFYSNNPTVEWDGTFQEKPCELGTYFYLFNGQCITGRSESKKGEITLIR